MDPIDIETARHLIDFSGGQGSLKELGELQLKGAVTLHNMIADETVGMGYLADEVGMGKTYIALGVVALMRYFNPTLRVLYICPSRNVQEKWQREYLGFIKDNIKVNHYRIRTEEGKPAAPFINCHNVNEMITMAATGYYADFFVGKDSFSLSLSYDEADEEQYWKEKCDAIKALLPAYKWDGVIGNDRAATNKDALKEQYAKALNYVLPTFDLVVIDEAHNFKHGFDSSDRNKVLSRVLGFNDKDTYQPRVKNALLLSATPYDRNFIQLENQLKLIGKEHLLPNADKIKSDEAKIYLKRFMVRRLNQLMILDKPYTRNMYRKEHRFGAKAEITLVSDEQKLVTALVQKKVSETLITKGVGKSFQTGMLASFESYSQTAKTERVQFDESEEHLSVSDAQDRNLIDNLATSYKEMGLGRTLPHPKMDQVTKQLSTELFEHGRKQLVFVRRVKSVAELKDKLDESYNNWIEKYILDFVNDKPDLVSVFERLFAEYRNQSQKKAGDISEGEYVEGEEGDTDDLQPPKNDTFFSWFFRGKSHSIANDILTPYTSPELLRRSLTAKNQKNSLLMELNWAIYLCQKNSEDLMKLLIGNIDAITLYANRYTTEDIGKINHLDAYQAAQLGFVVWYGELNNTRIFVPIADYLKPLGKSAKKRAILSNDDVVDYLSLDTLYTEIDKQGLSVTLFPLQDKVFKALSNNEQNINVLIDKLDIHWHLVSVCLRTGHGIIDMFINRLRYSGRSKDGETGIEWVQSFVSTLKTQALSTSLSTFRELQLLAEQLDLIIKTNIPQISELSKSERRMALSKLLNPVAPIIGATGETYNIRSAQARKFRMPGYPLALISTDVFQEGEDLHTFCDSVVHYGLSGSPVSIEQKTGRVDRVTSMVQRRLLSYDKQQIDPSDLIQVVFPYVKESIELLQVRQLCRNINEFIASLHEIGGNKANLLDVIDAQESLLDPSEIPDQILALLSSPYDANDIQICVKDRIGEIKLVSEHIAVIRKHVKDLLKEVSGDDDLLLTGKWSNNHSSIDIRLMSARSTGIPILSLTTRCEQSEYHLSENNLVDVMTRLSHKSLNRIQAVEIANGQYELYKNNELLVGDSAVTQQEDIEDLFHRFEYEREPKLAKPTSQTILNYLHRLRNESLNEILAAQTISIKIIDSVDSIGIKFKFGNRGIYRHHTVWVYQDNGYCIMIAKAVSADKLLALSQYRDKKILTHTWIRNCHIDVVSFFLDLKGGISGRVSHPVVSLNWEEFIFCAYVLAVEADRLEYVFDTEDEY